MKPMLMGWLLALALLVGLPGPAWSQADLQLQVSSYEISVGETLDVQLDAMSSDDQTPSNPELVTPNGFEVRGPSVGTRQQVSITGFRMVRQTGISATWQLTATRKPRRPLRLSCSSCPFTVAQGTAWTITRYAAHSRPASAAALARSESSNSLVDSLARPRDGPLWGGDRPRRALPR